MNNSNLVICNLENNIAQLLVANKKHSEQTIGKMDKIVEEKSLSNNKLIEDIKSVKKDIEPVIKSKERSEEIKKKNSNKQELKNHSDTASQSLENPKSSTKSGSDVSSGLSKSVPPSYKQKILQFSRDKLRFASGGNKLTRSIKRSFHFSRSWDKNKAEVPRRTSEPIVDISKLADNENKKTSKEEKDEDIEKSEIIEDIIDDKEIANNDNVQKPEENQIGISLLLFLAFFSLKYSTIFTK